MQSNSDGKCAHGADATSLTLMLFQSSFCDETATRNQCSGRKVSDRSTLHVVRLLQLQMQGFRILHKMGHRIFARHRSSVHCLLTFGPIGHRCRASARAVTAADSVLQAICQVMDTEMRNEALQAYSGEAADRPREAARAERPRQHAQRASAGKGPFDSTWDL